MSTHYKLARATYKLPGYGLTGSTQTRQGAVEALRRHEEGGPWHQLHRCVTRDCRLGGSATYARQSAPAACKAVSHCGLYAAGAEEAVLGYQRQSLYRLRGDQVSPRSRSRGARSSLRVDQSTLGVQRHPLRSVSVLTINLRRDDLSSSVILAGPLVSARGDVDVVEGAEGPMAVRVKRNLGGAVRRACRAGLLCRSDG